MIKEWGADPLRPIPGVTPSIARCRNMIPARYRSQERAFSNNLG